MMLPSSRYIKHWLWPNIYFLPSCYLLVQSQQWKRQNNVTLINTPEQWWRSSGTYIANFNLISQVVLVFPLFPLNKELFLSTIWLPHGQLWAITEWTASLSRCYHYIYSSFSPMVTDRESRSEVGSLSPAERLVGFEPGTFPIPS